MEKLFELGIKRFYLRSNGTSRETEQAPGISFEVTDEDYTNAIDDFERVYKTIDSCTNLEQLEISRNAIHYLVEKHPFLIVIEKLLEQKVVNRTKQFPDMGYLNLPRNSLLD
jgi:hypothetical protein